MFSPYRAAFYSQRAVWLSVACLNVSVPIAVIWEYRSGNVNSVSALLSAACVLLFLNSVVLWTVSVRSKREGMPFQKKLILAAGALAVVAFLSTILGVSLIKQRNGYLDLAMSDTPLSSIQPERKRIVVELIRRSAANSQEENKAMAEAQKVPLNPAVYSAESFASQQVIDSTLTHLATYTEIDFQYFAKQQAAQGDFRRKMTVCDAEYLRTWEAERRDQEDMEKSVDQLEHDWFASVNALYSYGRQHNREIEVKGENISISNPTVCQTFDDLFRRSKALHEKLENSVQEEVRHQQQAKARLVE